MESHSISSPAAMAFVRHDHARCAATVLARAEQLCRARGLRLTPVRRRTLEILLDNHCAQGAYDVLDRLAEAGFARQPPVAYRALDFLVAQGFAHRIDRLNAFAACMHPGEEHEAAFLICRCCRGVAEAPAGRAITALGTEIAAGGFAIEAVSVEVLGLCPVCRSLP